MTVNSSQSFFLVCSFLLISSAINAQQVYVETGFSSAFFKDYVNNLGENTLDLSYSKSQESFLESGFRFNLFEERVHWDVGFSYNKYKINTGFYAGNISVPATYNLSYLTLKIGAVLNIVNEPRFKIQIHSHLSYDGLITGTNSYRDVITDLYKDDNFDKTLLRFHRGVSTEYTISKQVAIYLSYNIADSFKEKGKDSNSGESYALHTNSFSMGLLFDISRQINRLFNRFLV
jgi:hypothetical protein